MPRYTLGARGHDYGNGAVKDIFAKIKAGGWDCTQLAFKKLVAGIGSYQDVTPEVVKETQAAMREVSMEVAVLGTYVELGILDETQRKKDVSDFISQLAVCKALNAGCIGSETTPLSRQPEGFALADAGKALRKSLEAILPEAERQGVIVGLEPVWCHTMNSVEATRSVLDDMQSPNLKIIFDIANLLAPEWVEKQEVLYCRAMESWGDQVVAVHFKGESYDGTRFRSCGLKESIVDYRAAFRAMKGLPQEMIPVLREEAKPAIADEDREFMRQCML